MFAGEPPPEVGFFYSEGPSGNRFRGTWLERITVPLPADYVYGFDLQRRDFEAGFESYLAGEWRHHGWWYYYLYAMAVKVPLGILILVVSNIVWTLSAYLNRVTWFDEFALVVPAIVILAVVSSQTGFNHHMRYLLPFWPYIFISTSKLAARRMLIAGGWGTV